ncbi:MAG: hypothetical protein SRB2_04152 [Desulfobacteraceae bacterium Eth-SRB2]|nr:MAG: hypothetical protein SRB2_04152 [Desulfobacteraceae bacterium Eth-SRB2]
MTDILIVDNNAYRNRFLCKQLDSIGISFLDTDYTDGHGLKGSVISEIRVRDFLNSPEGR